MEPSRLERSYKRWIISLVALVLVMLVISTSLLTLLLSSGGKVETLEQKKVETLARKPRGFFDKLGEVVEETLKEIKMDFLASDICVVKDETDEEAKAQPVCITKHCTETAATIISAMDKSVDPCQDFFTFACGGFVKKNPVPKDQLFISTSMSNYKFYQLLIKRILEETDYTKEPNIVFKMIENYHVCLNTTYQANKETEAFKRILHDELDGWPNVGPGHDLSIEEYMGILLRHGYNVPFVKIGVYSDSFGDPRRMNLIITNNYEHPVYVFDHGGNGTTCNIKSKGNILEKLGHIIGHNETCFQNKTETDMINQLHLSLKSHVTGQTSPKTISDLTNGGHSKFDWLKLINTVFDGIHTFTANDRIIVLSPEYFDEFNKAYDSQSTRLSSSFYYYIRDHIVQEIMIHGGPEISSSYHEFLQAYLENYQVPSRDDVCLDWTMKTYPYVITRLVAKQYLDPRMKESATKMVDLIVNAYIDTINGSVWVDQVTKDRAILKAKSITKQIAYPEYVLKDDEIEKKFSTMPPVYSTHIENFIAIQHNTQQEDLKSYDGAFDPLADWLGTPLTINAGYSGEFNTVIMQLGMLNLPYFDVNRIAAVNYGMVGSVVGHEIGHGFDTSGRLYDEIGRKTQWWMNATEQKYLKLAQCYIDQYSHFCPEELSADHICVDGEQTKGENLADNTGLKAAYEAYKSYVKEYGEEKRLPGLQEYSPEQIFFLSFAYAWCENIPPYNWVQRYSADEHSAGKYRVLGALSNSEDFARVFNCPPGPMNRDKERCTLW